MSANSGNEMSFDKQIFYTGKQYLDPKMKYCETKKELNGIKIDECFTGREVTVLKDEDNDHQTVKYVFDGDKWVTLGIKIETIDQ